MILRLKVLISYQHSSILDLTCHIFLINIHILDKSRFSMMVSLCKYLVQVNDQTLIATSLSCHNMCVMCLCRLERYQQAQLVDFKDFDDKMNEYYQNQDQETIFSWGNLGPSVPVAMKEIRTAFGKCFFLHNKANATLEQKIQGWKIYLHSNRSDKDIIWQVYLGYHGLEYPTFSDLGTHERFLLRPRTETFISFSLTHDTTLPYRGYFQQKKFCSEGDMYETIACIKKCFLDQNNVCNYASTLIDILDILLIYIFIYFACFSSIAPRLG